MDELREREIRAAKYQAKHGKNKNGKNAFKQLKPKENKPREKPKPKAKNQNLLKKIRKTSEQEKSSSHDDDDIEIIELEEAPKPKRKHKVFNPPQEEPPANEEKKEDNGDELTPKRENGDALTKADSKNGTATTKVKLKKASKKAQMAAWMQQKKKVNPLESKFAERKRLQHEQEAREEAEKVRMAMAKNNSKKEKLTDVPKVPSVESKFAMRKRLEREAEASRQQEKASKAGASKEHAVTEPARLETPAEMLEHEEEVHKLEEKLEKKVHKAELEQATIDSNEPSVEEPVVDTRNKAILVDKDGMEIEPQEEDHATDFKVKHGKNKDPKKVGTKISNIMGDDVVLTPLSDAANLKTDDHGHQQAVPSILPQLPSANEVWAGIAEAMKDIKKPQPMNFLQAPGVDLW